MQPLTTSLGSGTTAAAAAALFWTSLALEAAAFCAALRSAARRLRSLRASASRMASAWRSRAFSRSSSSLAAVSSLRRDAYPCQLMVRTGRMNPVSISRRDPHSRSVRLDTMRLSTASAYLTSGLMRNMAPGAPFLLACKDPVHHRDHIFLMARMMWACERFMSWHAQGTLTDQGDIVRAAQCTS